MMYWKPWKAVIANLDDYILQNYPSYHSSYDKQKLQGLVATSQQKIPKEFLHSEEKDKYTHEVTGKS